MRGVIFMMAACAGNGVVAQTPRVIETTYLCERGIVVPVAYVDVDGMDGVAVITVEGRQVAMRMIPSGSGAKFASFDEQLGYRWSAIGQSAFLSYMAADHTAVEVELLTECLEQTGG